MDLAVEDKSSLHGSFEFLQNGGLKALSVKFEAMAFTPLETNEIEIDCAKGQKRWESIRSKPLSRSMRRVYDGV
jgi:hypothetical protein